MYWIVAFIMGAPLGVGIAFLIFGSMLDKSNNMGDSRLKSEEFTSDIIYLSEENRMPHNDAKFSSYVEMNIEALTKSRDFDSRLKEGIKTPPQALVERYIPGSEENDESADNGSDSGAGTSGASTGGASFPAESAWAAARRKNLQEDASENPWGRDDKWGGKDSGSDVMDEPKMDLAPEKKKPTQAEIDAFWSGGKKTTAEAPASSVPASSATAFSAVASSAPAAGAVPAPDASSLDAFRAAALSTGAAADGAATTGFFPGTTAEPSPVDEPIYEAPTAHRPLWLNSNPDDDFSDFEDM